MSVKVEEFVNVDDLSGRPKSKRQKNQVWIVGHIIIFLKKETTEGRRGEIPRLDFIKI
jgi:hypothetical protein